MTSTQPSGPGGIWRSLGRHRGALFISFAITVFAFLLYYITFIGTRPTPLFDFVLRLEAVSLDTRFRLRGPVAPDPRIVIVDIDQQSQEVLGRWPFSRSHFARMLDALREDGAKVVAFDAVFSKPDETADPIHALRARIEALKAAGTPVDPRILTQLSELQEEFNTDAEFAAAIERSQHVVLGCFFLHKKADLQGVSPKALEEYADRLYFFPFPNVRPVGRLVGQINVFDITPPFRLFDLIPTGVVSNIPALTDQLGGKDSVGFFNVYQDRDGVVRSVPLGIPFGKPDDPKDWTFYASIPVHASRFFLDLPEDQAVLTYGELGVESVRFGPDILIQTNPLGEVTVNYRGPVRTFPYFSIANVVQKKFTPGTFKDRIVLVGASAIGIGDIRSTPFGGLEQPGVEIHANVLDNILNNRFLKRGANQQLTDQALIFLFGLPLGIWLAIAKPKWLPFGLLLLIPFAFGLQEAFERGWWLNFTIPALFTLVPNVALVALYRVLVEDKEKRKVRGAFAQYLSPEVIRRLLENPDLVKPRKTELTVLFSDIRGFTSISEKLDAQELAHLLNEYLTEMTEIVFASQGTLDKYIGDAVMAFWGAPFEEKGHERNACIAALEMMRRLAAMQKRWRDLGRPHIDIGIGLNTGVASVGNMGSELRYGYTAMGDAVNLAARLEGVNKDYGTHILLSEKTHATVKESEFLFRELDFIRVKGKEQPIPLYELMGTRDGDRALAEMVTQFALARDLYKQRNWAAAQAAFEQILTHWPEDGPSRLFIARCAEYAADDPGPAWDGVYIMKHK